MESKESQENALNFRYTLTPALERDLLDIETAQKAVQPSSPLHIDDDPRRKVRVHAAYYTAHIESNELTLIEAEAIILHGQRFLGRVRDVRDLQNTYHALRQVELWAERHMVITGERIQEIYTLVEIGSSANLISYRNGPNVIRNAATSALIYRPPEASEVPGLVNALVEWIAQAEREGLAAPLIAGLAHYQFIAIHPFFKNNGRIARALATWILYRRGYDLWRFGCLEELYARDLGAYHNALQAGSDRADYAGRAAADLTGWLEYFLGAMAGLFRRAVADLPAPVAPEVKPKARRKPEPEAQPEPEPQAEPEPKPKRGSAARRKPEAQPQPEPQVEPEPKPKRGSGARRKPEAQPEPEPQVEPEPKPKRGSGARRKPEAQPEP